MPVIQRLQNAMLEEKSSLSSDDGSQSADIMEGKQYGSIGTIPLKGKSRSWLSASRLQENLKKAVNTPFARSKSMTSQVAKPDPPLSEMFHETNGHKDAASLSFTAITESLSASSEDISEALGRKFEQLLHSALSSSEDSSLQPSSTETAQSASDDGTNGSRLWSTMFQQSASHSQSKDDDDTHTTERSSTRSQGTAELIAQFLGSVSSSSSSSQIPPVDSQLAGKMLSLLDGSTSEDEIDEGADLALFDEGSSSSGGSDAYSSDDCDSAALDEDDDMFGVAFSTVLAHLDGQCGTILGRNRDGDADSVASEPTDFAPKAGHQPRGRSRSPRPYTPFGLEMEPSEEECADFESQNPLEPRLPRQKEAANEPAMNVFQSMLSCFSPPDGTFTQNL